MELLLLISLEFFLQQTKVFGLEIWLAACLVLVVATQFLVLWQLLWISLAFLSRLSVLPGKARTQLAQLVDRWGGKLATTIVRSGAAATMAGATIALSVPLAQATAEPEQPSLLWPYTSTDQYDADTPKDSPEDPASPSTPATAPEPTAPEPQTPELTTPAPSATPEAAPTAPPTAPVSEPAPREETGSVSPTAAPSAAPSGTQTAPTQAKTPHLPQTQTTRALSLQKVIAESQKKNSALPASRYAGTTVVPMQTAPAFTAPSQHQVQANESLWSIAAEALGPSGTQQSIAEYWQQIYLENYTAIGNDPGLIFAGTVLGLPPVPLVAMEGSAHSKTN